MNMNFKRKLPIPMDIKAQYPLDEEMVSNKKKNDQEIANILRGDDNRLLLIIGPCSADREDAVLDYCKKLRVLQNEVNDVIKIIPRVYTGKPRTTGAGYKGMLHQPDPNQEPDMLEGIIAVRRLHMNVLKETGFSTADELLYPANHRYLNDLLSYVAVGARSVENQEHRLVASGLNIPVGMKNPTHGDLSVMINAIKCAQSDHTFIYRNWEVESTGNPLAHAILRGYQNKHGECTPNYHYEYLVLLDKLYKEAGLKNPSVIVDCNHANSNKQYLDQIRIAKQVLYSKSHNENLNKLVKGLMIESYLEDGAQKVGECAYGKSITDPCLGWNKTESLIRDIASELRKNK